MDGDLVRRALRRDPSAVRDIIKRHNQRLYRLARAVVGGNTEAEDVLQEAYLHAFANLESFRGESSLRCLSPLCTVCARRFPPSCRKCPARIASCE